MTTIATIGIAIAGLAVCDIVQGDQTMILPSEPLSFRVIKIAGLPFTPIGPAVVVFALLLLGIQRTPIGLRMRGRRPPHVGRYTGISAGRISAPAWGLAGATSGRAPARRASPAQAGSGHANSGTQYWAAQTPRLPRRSSPTGSGSR